MRTSQLDVQERDLAEQVKEKLFDLGMLDLWSAWNAALAREDADLEPVLRLVVESVQPLIEDRRCA